ncbi:alanine racemase [Microbacterium sp. NPDC055521]
MAAVLFETDPAALSTASAAGSGPSSLAVSTAAIQANTSRMRGLCASPVMAVVKAGGFGLGAARAARAALAGGATELGVATCAEAIELRGAGIEAPILAWMMHDDAPIGAAIAAHVRVSPTSPGQLRSIVEAAAALGVVAEVEIEVETGMNRSGAPRADWERLFDMAAAASASGLVHVVGVWTHLSGTSPAQFTAPLAQLADAVELARSAGLRVRKHAAASRAAAVDPRTHLDLLRLGASLFGVEPVPERPLGLAPVARWETRVSQTRDVRAGESVGYRQTPIASATRLALIPVGYADGISRRASGDERSMTVAVDGRRFPLIGAISMDQSVIDVGDAPVIAGDRVVLLGDPARGEPSLAEWSSAVGTIPQEVLTAIGPRVARTEVGA